jgi:hypothetical protein
MCTYPPVVVKIAYRIRVVNNFTFLFYCKRFENRIERLEINKSGKQGLCDLTLYGKGEPGQLNRAT